MWCEFPPSDELASSPLLALHGLSSEPLSAGLHERLAHRLAAACEQLDVERTALESTCPWLAAHILDGAHSTSCGSDSLRSIDTVVTRRAADIGVPVQYEYPTAEKAFGLFSGFSHEVELEYLRWTLDRSIHSPGACMTAARAWERGSLTELTDDTNTLSLMYPELFDVLVVATKIEHGPNSIKEMIRTQTNRRSWSLAQATSSGSGRDPITPRRTWHHDPHQLIDRT